MDPHPQLAFRNSSTQRSDFFNKLKPCCLEIAKALRKSGGRDADPREAADAANRMVALTDTLYGTLTEQVGYDAAVLDASMADYASFPLLTILQHMRSYPARLIENATKCLRVLIQYGWRTAISGENAQRLLILLTSVVTGGGPPAGTAAASKDALTYLPEETVAEGYRALAALMKAAGAASSKPGSAESPLVTANVVPVLAHAVSVMLEGVTDSIIPAIQIEALGSLEALYTTVKDQEALASFLPGTVSALVRVVAQPGAHKTLKRVVVRTLEVLFAVLVNTLGDLQTRRLQRGAEAAATTEKENQDEKAVTKEDDDDEVEEEIISDTVTASQALPPQSKPTPSSSTTTAPKNQKNQQLDAAWLKATAAQIKLALTSVLKLRNHESEDVRDALQQFCVGLLDECHTSLADSTSILVESAIVTSPTTKSDDDTGGDTLGALKDAPTSFRSFGPQTTLQHLAILYPELSDVIKSTAYNWATSLPRAMQAGDEGVKQRALRNVQKAIAVVDALHIDSTVLQASLSAALRDSIATLVHASAASRAAVSEAVSEDAILQLAESKVPVGDGGDDSGKSSGLVQSTGSNRLATQSMAAYKPVLLALGSQKDTRDAVLDLIAHIGPPPQQAQLAGEMLDVVRDADGVDQVSAFWLSFELVKAAFASAEEDPDSFLDLSSFNESAEAEAVFEDLFSFSVSALASYSDVASVATIDGESDWRIGAIALEVTAYAAARLGEAFRPELIDVLYPIATYLGAPEDRLRAHAVATLNSLATSCAYESVSALIVDNVDYMLNSVSLRLNTFDISPASTRVLTMMIRLAGPRLVPYLDDVVAAIFAALDNYHGYPLFVENLFAVLSEVVQQSVQPASSALLLEDGSGSSSKKKAGTPATQKNLKRRPDATSTDDLVAILDRRTKRRKELEKEAEDDDVEEIGHPKQPWKEAPSEADKLLRKHEKKAKKSGGGEGEEEDDDDDDEEDAPDTNKEGNEVGKPEDPKTPTYALLARITTLTQHYLTAPTPTLRKSLLDLLGTVAPALAGADENAFLPLVNAVWPVVVARLYDGEPYVVMAACEALAALCGSAGDFLATRIKAEWHAKLGGWSARAKAAAASKSSSQAKTSSKTSSKTMSSFSTTTPGSSNLRIGGRPSVIHIHQRASAAAAPTTDVVVPLRPAGGDDQLVASSSTGLGRFAQAVQVWEAVANLLTAIVAYVKLDDDVYDAILDLLLGASPSRVLPVSEERKAREALAVVNQDAVWLARYRAGRLDNDVNDSEDDNDEAWMVAAPPVLAGVSFVPLVG